MSGVFDGKSVLVSGTFSQPKTRISEAIRNAGGKVTTVIGRADFVVADTPTNKDTVAALKAGVPALSETWVADCVTAGNLIDDTKYYVSPLSAKVVATAAVAVATATVTTTSTRPRRGAAAAATPVVSAPSAAAPAPTTTGRARRAAPTAAASATASAAAVAVAPPTKRGAQTAAAKAAAAATTAAVAAAASKLAAAPTVADTAAKAGGSVVAPVDAVCSLAGSYAVYQDKDGPWDAMLNQTNIGQNNNKFYLLQLLQNTSTGSYATWFRWGRVGLTGSYDLQHHSTLAGAQSYFRSKYSDKTVNAWRAPTFTARSGKYTLLVRDYVIVKEAETKKSAAAQKKFESKLPANIQSLVSLISDVQMMKKQMVKAGYDADRMPLGKLSKETLLEGYTVLSKIATIVNAPKKTASHRDELKELSSRFYTLIPHSFGMSVPPVLDTEKMVKEKVEMIESLAQIDTAIQIVKSEVPTENPIDTHYKKLKCAMGVVDKKSAEWKLVQEYLTNTHASTHSWYSLELKDVISLDREGEKTRFDAGGFNKDKNRQLLWHGSRLSNFVGILSQGLRIAPPEAPVTGYMFGKGVYFADMISKSANYCAAQIGDDACLLLCEVALGTPNELKHSDYNANKLPKGKLSTKGLGSTFPGSHKVIEDGIKVPCGTPVTDNKGGSLLYNEFIVYDVAQIKMRYIVRVGFNRRK